MKKFKFTLEPVLKYKKTVEKQQKAELSRIMGVLHALQDEQNSLTGSIQACEASLAKALRKSRNLLQEMEQHHLYLRYLHEQLAIVEEKIAQAEEEKQAIQAKLIVTMKELKTLERLRTEQFAHYLEEVRKDEEKVLGDLMSYKSTNAEQE